MYWMGLLVCWHSPDNSIKLIYGSPPYPNAERNYGIWRSGEYIEKMTPFIDAAKLKLRDDGVYCYQR